MVKRILAFVMAGALAASLAVLAADAPKAAAPKNDYVGANKCKMCHMKQAKAWAETKHAHALEGLKAATPEQIKAMNELLKTAVKDHPEADSVCVRCHVTGYRQPGGYPAADSVKTAAVAFVGCEMCHGPGSQHLAVPMSDKEGRKKTMLAPTVETCQKCHTDAISPKFDFAVMSKQVHAIPVAAPAK
jgi:ribosomal protein L40E